MNTQRKSEQPLCPWAKGRQKHSIFLSVPSFIDRPLSLNVPAVVAHADRVVRVEDGRLVEAPVVTADIPAWDPHGAGDVWPLIEFAQVVAQRRVVLDTPQVALERAVIAEERMHGMGTGVVPLKGTAIRPPTGCHRREIGSRGKFP